MRVLFVCLGNICRSPAAEGIFQHLINSHQLTDTLSCDSAGIIGFHSGNRADSRMISHAHKRGYHITSRSRKFDPSVDFDNFDLIVGMDHDNIEALHSMVRTEDDACKIQLMTRYATRHSHDIVPDPYYGGEDGFELVIDILEDACSSLIQKLAHRTR